ncbi:MAG: hypothetical protein ACFWTM_02495 [Mitsuokella multacida]
MSFVYITEDGAFIRKRGGSFVVGQGEQEVMEIPEAVLYNGPLVKTTF